MEVVSEIENVSTYESNLTAFFGGGFFLGHKEHIFCELVVVGGIISVLSSHNLNSTTRALSTGCTTHFCFRLLDDRGRSCGNEICSWNFSGPDY